MKAAHFKGILVLIAVSLAAGIPLTASATVIENFDVAPNTTDWTLSGNAAWDADFQALFMTPATADQIGSIFWSTPITTASFNIEFDLWIGGGDGADGMAFAWVRGPGLLGGGGGSMGFDGLDGYGVRFDTYTGGDPEPENYIAISEVTPSARTDLITNDTIPEMEDSATGGGDPAPFHVKIEFDNGHLQMWMSNPTSATAMPETLVFDYTIAGYTAFDGYFGFTGATGGATNVHAVDSIVLNKGATAGDDQVVLTGDPVTLDGSASYGATSYAWTQIAGSPTVTLDNANPPDGIAHFTAPALTVGTVLTFQLEIQSADGPSSDTVRVTILAKNAPGAPTNLQALRKDQGLDLSWDSLLDAEEYVLEIEVTEGVWWPLATVPSNTHTLSSLSIGQLYKLRVLARNTYGDSPPSDVLSYVVMANTALAAGGTPPSGYDYAVSHYDLADLNDGVVAGDNNDSWDGTFKAEDHWGYTWDNPLYFQHVIYFMGNVFGDGAWWTSLKVQYTEDGTTWQDVRGLDISPPFDFTDDPAVHTGHSRYDLTFTRVNALGIRIFGTPGGTNTFTSISELEVYGDQDPNAAVADPGPNQMVQEGDPVTLDATASLNAVGFAWVQVSGPTVTLNDAATDTASFTAPSGPPDVIGDTGLVFQLTITDAQSRTSSAPVTITVVDGDAVTAATTGSDTLAREGAEVNLVGSASVNGVNFKWTQIAGPQVIIADDTAADTTFRAPPIFADTTLTFELLVDNGPGQHSDTATTTVTVEDRDNAIEVVKFDMTGIFNRDGIWSVAVGNQGEAGFDNGGDTLVENGYSGWAGLPSNRKVQDFELGNYDDLNMYSVLDGDGDTTFDLSASGQSGGFEKLRFLTGAGNGYGGSSTDKLAVRLRYSDASTQDFLLLSQDWYLGDPPRVPPAPLTLGIGGMMRGSGGPSANFGLYALEVQVDSTKTLTEIVFMETDPLSTIGVPGAANRFNVLAITGYPPSSVRTARILPESYTPGTVVDSEIYVYLDPGATVPANLSVQEQIPAGLSVADAGGGNVSGGAITWSFTGAGVQSQVISYSLTIPGAQTGDINFAGTASYGAISGQIIGGDQGLYVLPSAPQNLDVEMLLSAYVSWTAPSEGQPGGYHVYRSVNGGAWEGISGVIAATSFEDMDIVVGSTYRYSVSAVNLVGAEGPTSSATDEAMITMEIREAEDYNYGGGQYPGYTLCPAAVESPAVDDLGAGYDFFYATDIPAGDARLDYRPNDNCGTELREATVNIGWVTVGDWWRYTFDVPAPGPDDPAEGWVRIVLKVAFNGTVDLYWDEVLVDSLTFLTGDWGVFHHVSNEQYFQTTPGIHTLRVVLASGGMNFDTIGMGFNWDPPKRGVIWDDDFEDYTNLYGNADLSGAGYTVVNGGGDANGAWRLWNTAGDDLGTQPAAISGMTNNFVVTDSDLAPDVQANEELITPPINCTDYMKVRLDFSKNFRVYPDDTANAQIAEVDIRSSDDGITWGSWVNLFHYDSTTIPAGADPAEDAVPEQVDVSTHADGKQIQVRYHFFEAQYDYWFAIDDIVLTGELAKLPPPPPLHIAPDGSLSWEPFGGGNYTVQYTDDLPGGDWNNVPGTWPTTETTWPGEDISGLSNRYYRVLSE